MGGRDPQGPCWDEEQERGPRSPQLSGQIRLQGREGLSHRPRPHAPELCRHSPRCPRPRGPRGWAGCLRAWAQALLGSAAVLGSLDVLPQTHRPRQWAKGLGAFSSPAAGARFHWGQFLPCTGLAWPSPDGPSRPSSLGGPPPPTPVSWDSLPPGPGCEAQGASATSQTCAPASGHEVEDVAGAVQGHAAALMPYQAELRQWAGLPSP